MLKKKYEKPGAYGGEKSTGSAGQFKQGAKCPPSLVQAVVGGIPQYNSHHCITGYIVSSIIMI
tara:strand:+ start:848 stop:1036 length:189 start_codon:yes stop_codon:yes gene_type:complete